MPNPTELSISFTDSVSMNWIINPRMDLAWFIGGALAGYALFFMHAGLGWDMVGIWFLWVVFLDSPHFSVPSREPISISRNSAGGSGC